MADQQPSRPGAFDDLLKMIDRLPFVGTLKNDLVQLKEMLYDLRAPRVLALGVEGSGRTTLANALLDAPALAQRGQGAPPASGWARIDFVGRHFEWLEVDSEELADDARGARRRASLSRALDEATPDVVVLVCRASNVLSDAEHAHGALGVVKDLLGEERGAKLGVIAVVTRADELEPEEPRRHAPPYSDGAIGAIDLASVTLKKRLGELGLSIARPVPVSARTDEGASWNVQEVAEQLVGALPMTARVEAVRALAVGVDHKRELARTIVNRCSAIAVTVGLAPVPFADAAMLFPLQGVMISSVAYVAGQPWDRRTVLEFLASLGVTGGAGLGLRWGARELVKLIPGAGTLVSASVAGAGTLALGRSAIAYFVDGPGQRKPKLLPATTEAPPT